MLIEVTSDNEFSTKLHKEERNDSDADRIDKEIQTFLFSLWFE